VAVSDGAGLYTFSQVDPAIYQVLVESAGFKRFERGGINVGTQQSVTVDVSLEIGDTSQTVQVTTASPLLDTTNGSTSTALEEQKLLDLPVSTSDGRNQYTVINISQNVMPVIRGSGFIDQSDTSTVSIAGSPESTNQYLIDGVPITDTVNRPVIIPATEATQELKVQVTTYDAEVGFTTRCSSRAPTAFTARSTELRVSPSTMPTISLPIARASRDPMLPSTVMPARLVVR
jgi:hypothetical protein